MRGAHDQSRVRCGHDAHQHAVGGAVKAVGRSRGAAITHRQRRFVPVMSVRHVDRLGGDRHSQLADRGRPVDPPQRVMIAGGIGPLAEREQPHRLGQRRSDPPVAVGHKRHQRRDVRAHAVAQRGAGGPRAGHRPLVRQHVSPLPGREVDGGEERQPRARLPVQREVVLVQIERGRVLQEHALAAPVCKAPRGGGDLLCAGRSLDVSDLVRTGRLQPRGLLRVDDVVGRPQHRAPIGQTRRVVAQRGEGVDDSHARSIPTARRSVCGFARAV